MELLDRSVATVYRLGDVVVKLHRPVVSEDFLRAVRRVQRDLADAGFPAPRPLGEPVPHGGGTATAEEYLDAGATPGPGDRAVMAAGLARFVELCRPMGAVAGLELNPWRELAPFSAGTPVIAHTDWRAQNLRVAGGELVAVYDWESLSLLDEAACAGGAAAMFTADWSAGPARFPTPEESRSFLAEYEHARGRPFTAAEHALASARCAQIRGHISAGKHEEQM